MLSRPVSSVVLASPVALVTSRQRSHYRRTALTSSVAIVASLSIGVGVGVISLLCAILAACALVGFWFAATRSRLMRRCLDRHATWRCRARREQARQRAVCPAAPARRQQYNELRSLVEEIEREDPVEALRLELQELLHHFVHLSASHQRCLNSFEVSGNQPSTTPLSERAPANGAPAKHRREIAARRLQHREACTTRLQSIADDLDGVDKIIRLVAERVACANLTPSIDVEIGKRLTELDEVDEALRQLSA